MAQPTKRQLAKVRKARFLSEFRRAKVVALAARRVGVPRDRIYEWCRNDPTFKAALNNAQEEVMDMLELELHKLATGAYSKPIVSAGKLVAQEEIHDVRALELLMRAYRPKFRERMSMEVTGEGGGPVKVVKKEVEVTAILIADAARILMEAGIGVTHEQLALNAAAGPPPAENALASMRSARE